MTLDTSKAVLIPTLSDGSTYYATRVNLDGTDYDFSFSWSTREQRWYLDLYDAALGVLLVAHMKLVTSWPIWRYYHHVEDMPTGELYVLTRTADDSAPGLNDLGDGLRCELTYYPLLVV